MTQAMPSTRMAWMEFPRSFRNEHDLGLRVLPSVGPHHTGLALSGRF